jgi:hypothetical protein
VRTSGVVVLYAGDLEGAIAKVIEALAAEANPDAESSRAYFEEVVARVEAPLLNWRGADAEIQVEEHCAKVLLTKDGASTRLLCYVLAPPHGPSTLESIVGPRRWSDAEITFARVGHGRSAHYVVEDRRAGVRIACSKMIVGVRDELA